MDFRERRPSWTSSNGLRRDDLVSRATVPVRGCSGALLLEITPEKYSLPYHRSFYQDGLLCKVLSYTMVSGLTANNFLPILPSQLHI